MKKIDHYHLKKGMPVSVCCFFSVLFILTSSAAFAQISPADSSFYNQAAGNLQNDYRREIGQNLLLFNGSEYVRNGQKAKGFPFFESDNPVKGQISYNGIVYRDIDFRYDLVIDHVIINGYNNSSIQLIDQKVDSFSSAEHFFVFIPKAMSEATDIKPGFYERLYNGKTPVLARHEKKLIFPVIAEDEPRYRQTDLYYVNKSNSYHRVEGKSDILNLFQDRKEDLKKFIRTNKINFNRQFEDALVKIVAYYDQIKN